MKAAVGLALMSTESAMFAVLEPRAGTDAKMDGAEVKRRLACGDFERVG